VIIDASQLFDTHIFKIVNDVLSLTNLSPRIRSSPLSRSCPINRIFFTLDHPPRLRMRPPSASSGIRPYPIPCST
jgi:hypothetical protein